MRIDLVTVVHPEDVRNPHQKYTFMAPANSGIKIGDYVIVESKSETSNLGKVISILPDIEDEGSTINYIRSVSTLGNRELKKVLSRLVPVDLVNMEEEEQTEDVKDNIEISINLGDRYYSICQALEGKRFYLYFEEFTFVDCPADIERIEAHNIFSTKDEVLGIIELIYKNNIDSSKVIDIAKEISKII